MSDTFHEAPRLFVADDLVKVGKISLTEAQAHYLHHVMRLKTGDPVRLFNGRDGEWHGEGAEISKRAFTIKLVVRIKPQLSEPDLWLCCAPIKKGHFETMLEKATELGVAVVQPVLTARTQIREVNLERARAICIEAAEQSERMSVPDIRKPVALKELIVTFPTDRCLIVCAEWGDAEPVSEALERNRTQLFKSAIATGPEGGFSAEELDELKIAKKFLFVRLGPRILRADTAAIAALSCWQALCGDWTIRPRT